MTQGKLGVKEKRVILHGPSMNHLFYNIDTVKTSLIRRSLEIPVLHREMEHTCTKTNQKLLDAAKYMLL